MTNGRPNPARNGRPPAGGPKTGADDQGGRKTEQVKTPHRRTIESRLISEIPQAGFIKTTTIDRKAVASDQRALLMRKGNEFFNDQRYAEAERIFVTIGYSDGMIRLGDHYAETEPLHALALYLRAPERTKADALLERIAGVVAHWLRAD